jgi:hypothetical protein
MALAHRLRHPRPQVQSASTKLVTYRALEGTCTRYMVRLTEPVDMSRFACEVPAASLRYVGHVPSCSQLYDPRIDIHTPPEGKPP